MVSPLGVATRRRGRALDSFSSASSSGLPSDRRAGRTTQRQNTVTRSPSGPAATARLLLLGFTCSAVTAGRRGRGGGAGGGGVTGLTAVTSRPEPVLTNWDAKTRVKARPEPTPTPQGRVM